MYTLVDSHEHINNDINNEHIAITLIDKDCPMSTTLLVATAAARAMTTVRMINAIVAVVKMNPTPNFSSFAREKRNNNAAAPGILAKQYRSTFRVLSHVQKNNALLLAK